jgi:carbonic anhydrase
MLMPIFSFTEYLMASLVSITIFRSIVSNLTALLSKIRPAIDDETPVLENRHSGNDEFIEKVTLINVKRTMQSTIQGSPILKEMFENNEILLVGGVHNIAFGEVNFVIKEVGDN